MDNNSIPQATIQSMLEFAKKLGKDHGFKTDYSDQSIKKIDAYLNDLSKEVLSDPRFDDEALSGIALSLGIYIGEALRKEIDHITLLWKYGIPTTGGDPVAYLFFEGNEVYPVDWVAKQIAHGKRESVLSKFETARTKLRSILPH